MNAVRTDDDMMLDEGEANGRRILPAQWVDESTTPGPGTARPGLAYAYLWWTIEDTDAYTMRGSEGQFVYVDPTDADATYLETFGRSGKMIVYHGLSDQGMAAQPSMEKNPTSRTAKLYIYNQTVT